MATKLTTESDVVAALRNRFSPPEWALFTGVANSTGHGVNRWADAIAMGIWPSRGLSVAGFEVKVHRSDWLRELKNPEKAESISAYCDRWWIAAGSKDIVVHSELPPTWGLLVPHGKTMKIVIDAPKREPMPLDREFMAAILRRAAEHFDESRIRKDLTSDLRTQIHADVSKSLESQLEREREATRKATSRLEEIEKSLQLATDMHYPADLIGRAVSLIRKLEGWSGAAKQIERFLDGVERDKDRLDKIAQTLRLGQDIVERVSEAES